MFSIPWRWEISERLVLLREVFPLFISLQLCVCTWIYGHRHTHICAHTTPTCMWIFPPSVSYSGCFAGANTHICCDLCPLLPLGVWPGFITFHALVGYGGILVTNQNCKKSCFIFMTLFLPPPTLSSQFYIQEQKLALIYLQFMIQGPEAEQTLVLCNAQIFSNGAHICLEQLLQGFSEFHHIFSQDVPLTESRNRGFPSGGKISVWVIQEIWLQCFSSHSAPELCSYMQKRGWRLEKWKYLLCASFISKASLHFMYQYCPSHSLEGAFAGSAFHTLVYCLDLCSPCNAYGWWTSWF